jgi:type IV secretory pathway VirJ component
MHSRATPVWVFLLAWLFAGCGAPLGSKPGLYETRQESVALPDVKLDVTYVKPANPRSSVLVVFATGDGGWRGVSSEVFEHICAQGRYAAGFDSWKAVEPYENTGTRTSIADATASIERAFSEAKRALGLPDSTQVIVVGVSRGAGLAVFAAAQPRLRHAVAGAIGIALTLESDYLRAPDPAIRPAGIQVDAKERILFYPILPQLAPIPVAVIQSTNDSYVGAAESRRLMGPDTPALRLYAVEAQNHSFRGGVERLLADLDNALNWIEATRRSR